MLVLCLLLLGESFRWLRVREGVANVLIVCRIVLRRKRLVGKNE